MGIQLPKELQITLVTKAYQSRVLFKKKKDKQHRREEGGLGVGLDGHRLALRSARCRKYLRCGITKNKDEGYSVQAGRLGSPTKAITGPPALLALPPAPSAAAGSPPPPQQASPQARPKKSESFYSFEVDEAVHIRNGEDGRPKFVCDICQTSYQRLHSLKRHYYRTHINHKHQRLQGGHLSWPWARGGRILYCCYPCRSLYDSLPAVVEHHAAAHTGKTREAPPGKRLECDKCDETFATKRDLEKHREVHACSSFACKFCDQVFPCEVRSRKRHEKIHSREARPAEAGSGQTIAKINFGGVKISVGIGNLQQLKKFQEACKEVAKTSNGTISLESDDLEALERLEDKPVG
ncbi:Protein suppressor of hairy wing [Amphibalanus amphitrite]|uniref:Protein suppressor of hairy wing n=1 Tax=Amphibalanus amphitrite TaxID=1232801 RepID=A0A6A4V1L1_AMPAM|nr:Protein suppressor of hairy wing [Amphibalanus amphitrite]